MAYTGSKAIGPKGLVIAINTGTASAPTWTPILESAQLSPNGYEMKVDDATNFASTAAERISTLPDGGTWDVAGNWISTDPGQIAVQAALVSGALKPFKATFPLAPGQSTSGDTFAFSAIVTKWMPDANSPEKKIPMKGTFATSNGVTFTAGS